MFRYVDASCLLRLLFSEPGPRMPVAGATIVSSALAEVEVYRAIERARLTGVTNDQATAALHGAAVRLFAALHLVAVDDAVIAAAKAAFTVNVRALDALHVATAQSLTALGHPLEFWTHDARQALAANARGLATFGER